MKTPSIYKYNKTTGLWDHQRKCEQDLREWLHIYASTEPEEFFTYGYGRPKGKPRKRYDDMCLGPFKE